MIINDSNLSFVRAFERKVCSEVDDMPFCYGERLVGYWKEWCDRHSEDCVFDESEANKYLENCSLARSRDGEKLYAVTLGTGTVWVQTYEVYAYNEQEAVDLVADYCEENELVGLYSDHYELADLCEVGQTIDEYAEANNLTCCGNHGIYMQILRVKEVL